MDGLLVVALSVAIGCAVGILITWLALGRSARQWQAQAISLEGAVTALRTDNEALRGQLGQTRSLDDLLKPVRESLDSLRRATDTASRDRTAAEATLTTQIAAVQERYQSLETATKQVAGALARGQTRGQWGEMQLEGLLSHAGLLEGAHYRRQDSRPGDDKVARPDVVVLMPGGGEVFVDAKFPFDAYWAAVATDDAVQRDAQLAKHAADVLARARELSSKRYSEATGSADFVVMFLPLESLLSAALEVDGLLLERTFERRVILATPTTMLALLRTIAFGYQRALMAENAEEIKAAGAEMLTRLGVLVEHLESMRRGLDQAVRGYNKFVGSFDSQALRQARRLSEMGVVTQRDLDPPAMIEVDLRGSDAAALRG
jgi:DNA recombination protein RmuC